MPDDTKDAKDFDILRSVSALVDQFAEFVPDGPVPTDSLADSLAPGSSIAEEDSLSLLGIIRASGLLMSSGLSYFTARGLRIGLDMPSAVSGAGDIVVASIFMAGARFPELAQRFMDTLISDNPEFAAHIAEFADNFADEYEKTALMESAQLAEHIRECPDCGEHHDEA